MQASDIKWYLTVNAGTLNNGGPQTDVKLSRGANRSSTEISSPYAVFDNVSAVENAAGLVTEYRCIVMKNNHPTEALTNISARIQGTSNSPTLVGVAWEDTGGADGTEDSAISFRATESTAPPGYPSGTSAWSQSTSGVLSGAIVCGIDENPANPLTLLPGGYVRMWLSRMMGGSETANIKQATVTITGDYYTP
jgi:hypothetical protein